LQYFQQDCLVGDFLDSRHPHIGIAVLPAWLCKRLEQ
jgi:hypothetical protein